MVSEELPSEPDSSGITRVQNCITTTAGPRVRPSKTFVRQEASETLHDAGQTALERKLGHCGQTLDLSS